MVELVQRLGRRNNQNQIGRPVEVLVERASKQASADGDSGTDGPPEVMGRNRGHKPVNFASTALPGDLVTVELVDATSTSFRGRQIGGIQTGTDAGRP